MKKYQLIIKVYKNEEKKIIVWSGLNLLYGPCNAALNPLPLFFFVIAKIIQQKYLDLLILYKLENVHFNTA